MIDENIIRSILIIDEVIGIYRVMKTIRTRHIKWDEDLHSRTTNKTNLTTS